MDSRKQQGDGLLCESMGLKNPVIVLNGLNRRDEKGDPKGRKRLTSFLVLVSMGLNSG